MTKQEQKPLSIGDAAEATGTTVKMLRYWEDKGYISPERVYSGSRGFRWYFPEDLQKITRIKNYIDQGYTLQAAAQMAEAVIRDSREIMPCAVRLEGEYGISGVVAGVPVKLGTGGIEQIIELKLTESEQKALEVSADAVRGLLNVMGI